MTTILIADDDPKLLKMVRRTLIYEGFQVTTATNGRETLDQIQAERPDLIILDWMMPELDGLAVLTRLREAGDDIPILMLTAKAEISEKIEGSSRFAIHVKGLELPGYDPRGMKGQGLTYAVSDRGGCHVRSNTLRTELLGLPEPIDRYAYENKAEMVRNLQLGYATFDCIISCLFGAFAIMPEDYADAISAETGWPITPEKLRTIAERAWNLSRLFNVREGFSRAQDTLPERLFAESSTAGPSKGQKVDRQAFEKMLDEYYEAAGWDKTTGIPTEIKLEELGIKSE